MRDQIEWCGRKCIWSTNITRPKWMLLTWSCFIFLHRSVQFTIVIATIQQKKGCLTQHMSTLFTSDHSHQLCCLSCLLVIAEVGYGLLWEFHEEICPRLPFYSLGLCWINGFVITAPIEETFEKTSGTAWICTFTFQHVNIHSLFHNAYMCNSVLLSQWRCRKDTRETTVSCELSVDCEEIYTF